MQTRNEGEVVFAVHELNVPSGEVFASDEWLLRLGFGSTVAEARALSGSGGGGNVKSEMGGGADDESKVEPGLIVTLDDVNTITDVNESWLAACGYARSEVIGRTAAELIYCKQTEKARLGLLRAAIEAQCLTAPHTARPGASHLASSASASPSASASAGSAGSAGSTVSTVVRAVAQALARKVSTCTIRVALTNRSKGVFLFTVTI